MQLKHNRETLRPNSINTLSRLRPLQCSRYQKGPTENVVDCSTGCVHVSTQVNLLSKKIPNVHSVLQHINNLVFNLCSYTSLVLQSSVQESFSTQKVLLPIYFITIIYPGKSFQFLMVLLLIRVLQRKS